MKATGYQLQNPQLMSVSPYLTTYNMRSALKTAGFDILTDSKYLKSDAYLLAGDILLNDNAHAAINVTNGVYGDTSYGTPQNLPTSPGKGDNSGGSTSTPLPSKSVKKGDLVAITSGAVYYTGTSIPSWVMDQRWYIVSIGGERAVLGKNEAGDCTINSPVHTKYLTVIISAGEKSETQPGQNDKAEEKYGDRIMKKGCRGDDVRELQKKLLSLGYFGEFENETDKSVREFQKDNNLLVDGEAGPLTIAAIEKKIKK